MRTLIYPKVLQPLLTQALSALDSPDIITHMGVTQDDLLKLHFDHHARLIVTRPDLPGLSCDRFVQVIRRNEAVRKVSIMLLIADIKQDIIRARSYGANIILPLSTPVPVLGKKIEELLDIPPRRPYRVVLNMTVDSAGRNRSFLCNMENISCNGMLVRASENLALGDQVSCSFYLPLGRRVSVTGHIARAISGTDADPQHRYGVQFADLAEADDAAISYFVNKNKGNFEASGDDKKA